MNRVFLDASYAIALATPRDGLHRNAHELSDRILRDKPRLYTTEAVVLEIGNFFSRHAVRPMGARLIAGIYRDPLIEILHTTTDDHRVAFQLFRDRSDKEWGLTDCLSFVVMRQNGLTDALTSDRHFQQAGFRTLLSEGET